MKTAIKKKERVALLLLFISVSIVSPVISWYIRSVIPDNQGYFYYIISDILASSLILTPLVYVFVYRHFLSKVEDKEYSDSLRELAYSDSLTGLSNRRGLEEYIPMALERSARSGAQVAFIMVDLDDFKKINDTYGHTEGDKFICLVADRIRSVCRASDFISRIGGDEFLIVLENLDETTNVSRVAEEIISKVSYPVTIVGDTVSAKCSIGVSVSPEDASNFGDLIRYSDIAMHKAKTEGKGCYRTYSSGLLKDIYLRDRIKKDIYLAITEPTPTNHIFMLYQPLFDAYSRKISGVEALVRWRNGYDTYVTPDVFIDIAEGSEYAREFDMFIFNYVFNDMSKFPYPVYFNINMEPDFMSSKEAMFSLKDLLDKDQELSARCNIEILEQEMVNITEKEVLRAKKFLPSLYVDDFGKGYSNLTRVNEIPNIAGLKIDMSVIEVVTKSPATVQAIIDLGHSFGLKVVAEGVETRDQLDILITSGIDIIQGYLISRPITIDELKDFIDDFSTDEIGC